MRTAQATRACPPTITLFEDDDRVLASVTVADVRDAFAPVFTS